MKNSFSYFENKECKYYPCHKTNGVFFNCLFCYCPLYTLGDKCGGNYIYNKEGIKDCSNCLIPHNENGYLYITEKFPEIAELLNRDKA